MAARRAYRDHVYAEVFMLSEHIRELYVEPTAMVPHGMVLITRADENLDSGDAIRHERADALFAHEKADGYHFAKPIDDAQPNEFCALDEDEDGRYVELCFTSGHGQSCPRT